MRPQRYHFAIAGALALALASPSAAQDIDTRTDAGTYTYAALGETLFPDQGENGRFITNVGQTFVAPTGKSVLDTFSFFLTGVGVNPGSLLFRAYVLPWDPAARYPSGTPIWSSATRPGTTDSTGIAWPRDRGWVEYAFDTGGLALDPTRTYLALLSTIETPSGGTSTNQVQWVYPAAGRSGYTGGHGVFGGSGYLNGAGTAADLVDSTSVPGDWDYTTYGSPREEADAAFTASFSAVDTTVPEPVSMALLGTGLAGVAAARRRRRRGDR